MKLNGRGVSGIVLAVGLLAINCGKPDPLVEQGALLVRFTAPPEVSVDELRVWIYDDGGVLFDDRRIPEAGPLPPPKAGGELGTVLVQPGSARGNLRLHARGMAGGVRKLDGTARVDLTRVKNGTVDLALFAVEPTDGDGDGVPDDLDDCPTKANPRQGGCGTPTTDAADDAATDGGQPSNDAGQGGSAGSAGGAAGRAVGTGGAISTGGVVGSGGTVGTGGAISTGGAVGSGGRAGTGGAVGSGGRGTGGAPGTGGMPGSGGRPNTGGAGTGGAPQRKALGATCGGATECSSNFCVDGVCCESACNMECQVCAPVLGRCLDVARADDVPQCAGTRTCNARAKCVNN